MIELLICVDHQFVMTCGIMLKSLQLSNNSNHVRCHIIHGTDLTESDKKDLQTIVEDWPGCILVFYSFGAKLTNYIPSIKYSRYSEAIFYRLFASSVLPKVVNKVIYLDCDVIIKESLSELWNLNIDNVALAGVLNPIMSLKEKKRIGEQIIDHYINSGVLLINLDYWRKYNIEAKLEDFIRTHLYLIKLPDQDAINFVLKDSHRMLPLKYNVQSKFLIKQDDDKYQYELTNSCKSQTKELREAREHPVIIHYTDSDKPWHKDCNHPAKNIFLQIKAQTKWAEKQLEKPYSRSLLEKIKARIYKAYFWKL